MPVVWQVRDLVGHLGGVHRWATEIVLTGERAETPEPPGDDELRTWFDVAVVDAGSDRRWVLEGDGTSIDHQTTDVDATVSGDPVRLMLLLWRRIGLEDVDVQVDGDAGAAQRVLGRPLTP